MGRVYAIANQKGGVGKTTTALNLGAALQELGRSVLLIDLDPQASLTVSLGIDPDALDLTIYNVLAAAIEDNPEPSLCSVLTETRSGLRLIPANIELCQAEIDLFRATLGEMVLKEVVAAVRPAYDYIIIDCQPSLGLLTVNALAAADEVLIPLQADYLALKGVNLLQQTITTVRKKLNRTLHISGVVLTMADTRTLHARDVINHARATLNGSVRVFDAVVKVSVKLKEAPMAGESILTYGDDTPAAAAYRAIAREVDNG